jgi:hypothetical protein
VAYNGFNTTEVRNMSCNTGEPRLCGPIKKRTKIMNPITGQEVEFRENSKLMDNHPNIFKDITY